MQTGIGEGVTRTLLVQDEVVLLRMRLDTLAALSHAVLFTLQLFPSCLSPLHRQSYVQNEAPSSSVGTEEHIHL